MMRVSPSRALVGALMAAGGLCLAALPAAAFERFGAWSAALSANPDGEGGNSLFRYYAPQAGLRDARISELVRIGADFRFLRSLLDAGLDEATGALTGIAFSTARAGMVSTVGGDMRHLVEVEALVPARVEAAYAARGFEAGAVEGRTVLHIGAEGTWDFARADPFDPFEIGLGTAQRIALVGDTVIVSSSRASIGLIVQDLEGGQACTACRPWRAMADALRAAAGEGAHLDVASGWPGRFAFAAGDIEALGAEAAELAGFTLAMLAITARGDDYTPHIVVHFGGVADAEAGVAEIARRAGEGIALSVPAGSGQGPEATAVHPVEGGAVAVVTFAPGDLDTAYRTLGAWELAVGARDFRPLARR